ncbi:hypothetical protein MHZ93_21890 [Roseomonas sp. ACRSG]|nr:hypothetical protein [Roseomonas sp. ACRSG]
MPPSLTLVGQDPLGQFRHLAKLRGTEQPIPLIATRFSVRILGTLALVTAERCFRNAEKTSIEATMTFPVPVHAALVGLSAQIGRRQLVAQAQRKAQARERYEAAIDGGRTAVLHEEALRGIHMISVGHVPPGQTVAVQGLWVMPLAARSDGFVLSIPTTVGDIYGRSPLADSDDLTHAPMLHEAELEVVCDSGHAALVQGRLVEGRARVRLDAPIEILVTGAAVQPLQGVAADGRAVELIVAPAPGGDRHLDIVLLQDTSFSMEQPASGRHAVCDQVASKHAVALYALAEAATQLRRADRVDVWSFNSTARYLGSGVGPVAVGQALARMERPGGGTELQPAVDAVLQQHGEADVLLVTDGKSHALDVHAVARQGARFTVVLVGEDSLAANVGHLAALTGGQIFVSSGLDLPEVLQRAIASMRAPRLRQARVPQGLAVSTAEALAGGMRIAARWSLPRRASPVPDEEVSRAVAAYAAWLALPCLEEEDAVELAEAEGVVCHLTAMVLVDEAGEAQEGLPAQRKVPLMTPRTVQSQRHLRALAFPDMPMVSASLPPFALDLDGPKFCIRAAPEDGGLLREDHSPKMRRAFAPRERTPPAAPGLLTLALRRFRRPNLQDLCGQVDWASNPDALLRGEWHGILSADVLAKLHAMAKRAEVRQLAARLGSTAEIVALALLARAEAKSDRGAARLARAILGPADPADVETAASVIGL